MPNRLKGIVRSIWNGPFYIGALSPPVSVGDVLLKIMETVWRLALAIVGLALVAVLSLVAWIYVLEPMFFPPLKDQIQVEAMFDDGSGPPPIKISPAGAQAEKHFHCSPEFPLKIKFANRSSKPIGRIGFSIEGYEQGRSRNLVRNGGWRDADAVIPSGYTWTSCWGVWLEEGVQPSKLTYVVEVHSADEADPALAENVSLIPPPAAVPSSRAPEAKITSTPEPEPSLSLVTLEENDWEKIGMGCSCSFGTGAPLQEKLIAGGDGLTFFRLNGKEHLCPAPDTQAMFDGPVSMSCGSVAVQITPFGEVQPGFDGHSSKARLHLADTAGNVSLTGTWGCGC